METGKTIEREIKGGQMHAYGVTLRRGEFLRAVVTPQGVDVLATLIGPDGKVLLTGDLLKYPGPEPLSQVAEVEGAYRLEVKAAGAETVSGRYALACERRAETTEADRGRMAAETLLREAAALLREGSKESLGRALEKYGEGAGRLRALGDKYWEAIALYQSGRASESLGDRQKALEYYNQALPLRRAIGDRAGEARTLVNIGLVHYSLGEKQKVLEFYNQALPSFRSVGDRASEAATLNNIGLAYSTLGDRQKALDHYDLALPLRRAVGDRAGEATTLVDLMELHGALAAPRSPSFTASRPSTPTSSSGASSRAWIRRPRRPTSIQ